ncbi:MAG: ABC transporter permease [Actinomycetota bacterium]|nr:ABC transporter permease [Actinomycetota bacterium]
MFAYLTARIAWAVALFFAITMVTFVIFFVLPQPQVRAPGRGANAADIDIRNALRLHGSVTQQYWQFTSGFVRHGSLGRSYFNRQPVTSIIRRAAPVTLSLVLGGAVMWLLLAVPIGVLSALRPRSLLDRAGMIFVLIGVSAHPLWLGLILSYLLGFRLGAFPKSGYCDLFDPSTRCGGLTQWSYHLLLPWFTSALLFAALYARMIRASVIETLDEDHVRTARAKGASGFHVIRTHVIRNAMLPVVTMVGMDVGWFLTNAIFVETVFGLPGVGGLLRSSIASRDLPVILGIVMFTTTTILLINLLIDVVYALIDPRIQTSEFAAAGGRRRRDPATPVPVGTAASSAN